MFILGGMGRKRKKPLLGLGLKIKQTWVFTFYALQTWVFTDLPIIVLRLLVMSDVGFKALACVLCCLCDPHIRLCCDTR